MLLTKLRSENLWRLLTAKINRSMRLQLTVCHQKRAPLFAFFYKTRANAQQVLPVQTGLHQYDE